MPFFQIHVHEWNSGVIYEEAFSCPENMPVYEIIKTVLGSAEFARLQSVKFSDVIVSDKTTFADLGMKECGRYQFYKFHIRLKLKAGEPHKGGMDYRTSR